MQYYYAKIKKIVRRYGIIKIADHDFDDSKCKNCGYDKADECGHFCHSKNWFIKIVWKIVCFLCKLFRTNEICSCGAKHW